jgi:hypothetical protein
VDATRLLADAQNICSGASPERKEWHVRKHRTAEVGASLQSRAITHREMERVVSVTPAVAA